MNAFKIKKIKKGLFRGSDKKSSLTGSNRFISPKKFGFNMPIIEHACFSTQPARSLRGYRSKYRHCFRNKAVKQCLFHANVRRLLKDRGDIKFIWLTLTISGR